MLVHERAVRFEEVDAAGIVFFARFLTFCHDAMERVFDRLPGTYVDLITRRRIGFPTVHLEADWRAPLRYGDVARIETAVERVGTTSVTFRHVFTHARPAAATPGSVLATIQQVAVATDLDTMKKIPLPDDCRALLEEHRARVLPSNA